jgi:hypothetical protein
MFHADQRDTVRPCGEIGLVRVVLIDKNKIKCICRYHVGLSSAGEEFRRDVDQQTARKLHYMYTPSRTRMVLCC